MSINPINNNNNNVPSSQASTTPNATSSWGGWVGKWVSPLSSAMHSVPKWNSVVSYLSKPGSCKDSKEELCKEIERLTPTQFDEFRDWLLTGEAALFKPSYGPLAQALASHLQELCGCTNLSSRLQKLVGLVPASPLKLFRLIATFTQSNIWNFLRRDLIEWPMNNCDEAIIRHGVVDKTLTHQFHKDVGRAHYQIKIGNTTHDFPCAVSNKIEGMTKALQQLPVFKGINHIPFPVQEMLTQSTAITYVLMPLCEFCEVPSVHISNRIMVIEAATESSCLLTVNEKANGKMECGIFSLEYKYQFNLSKVRDDEWNAEISSFSLVKVNIEEEGIEYLLEGSTSLPRTQDSTVLGVLFGSLIINLAGNLEAIAKYDGQNKEVLERIEKQISKQWMTLKLNVKEKSFWQDCSFLKPLERVLFSASQPSTETGKTIFKKMQDEYAQLKSPTDNNNRA